MSEDDWLFTGLTNGSGIDHGTPTIEELLDTQRWLLWWNMWSLIGFHAAMDHVLSRARMREFAESRFNPYRILSPFPPLYGID